MTKKSQTGERSGYAYDSGLEIARQLEEDALSVASPRARFLLNTAMITKTHQLDFVKQSTHNRLIDDTLKKICKESDIITVERMIAAVVSGKYKKHKKESEE